MGHTGLRQAARAGSTLSHRADTGRRDRVLFWIPAFAGMTELVSDALDSLKSVLDWRHRTAKTAPDPARFA